jgi:prepilin-type N-terminal cleavage/methylation domain-containing protein
MRPFIGRSHGWSLVELLVVISIIGILIAFFVPPIVSRITTHARAVATRQELNVLRVAIMGDPEVNPGGELVVTGFKNDIGRYPRHLIELATRNPFEGQYTQVQYVGKETLPGWNPYDKRGWNGPYVREDGNLGYIDDVWGVPYRYWIDSGDTVGLESAGPDGLFFGQPGSSTDDDIRIRF